MTNAATTKRTSVRYMGVAKPGLTDAGCWAIVRRYVGSAFAQGTHCGNPPRKDALTCRYHAMHEDKARKLQVSGFNSARERFFATHKPRSLK